MDKHLAHYGVLGMKWGVRRYQNKDGSLKKGVRRSQRPLGNDRNTSMKKKKSSTMTDDELIKSNRRKALESKYDKLNRSNKLENTKKLADASTNLANQVTNADKKFNKKKVNSFDLSKSSDQELRDRINRANLERQYNDIFGTQEVSKGRQFASSVLEGAGSALAVTGSALGVALAIKDLRGK